MNGKITTRAALLTAGVMVALTACASEADAPPAAMTGHVHNLAFDGEVLLIGTHEGLWQHMPGSLPSQRSSEPFDVMGLARTGDNWIASGHPAATSGGHSNLGLMMSEDGETFAPVGADGVDFHRLASSGQRVLGVSGSQLLRSDDSGRSWTDLGQVPIYDLTMDPANPDVVVGTTADGLIRSLNGGVSFQPVASPALLALLSWSPGGLVSVGVDGSVFLSVDQGSTWVQRGSLPDQPLALASDGERVAALVNGTVLESIDGGITFKERLTGLMGH